MIAYKGFNKDLTCLGYQFVMGLNITEKANCRENGFHCAEDPLDCLTYYSCMYNSVYCLVDADGDMDEDDYDSKISCTKLNIIKQLSQEEFFLHALAYIVDHPKRQWNPIIQEDKAVAHNGYTVVRGSDPIACGKNIGDILAFAKESVYGDEIELIALAKVDGETIMPGVWYSIDLQERNVF